MRRIPRGALGRDPQRTGNRVQSLNQRPSFDVNLCIPNRMPVRNRR